MTDELAAKVVTEGDVLEKHGELLTTMKAGQIPMSFGGKLYVVTVEAVASD